MKYEEALEIIEDFNVNSGLRDFCTNVCKGKCCFECTGPCHKNNKRRLVCSTFFCREILDLIFDDRTKTMYRYEIHKGVTDSMDRSTKSIDGFPDAIYQLKDFDTEKVKERIDNFTPEQIEHLRRHAERNYDDNKQRKK
jgi:hypothetical protein